MKKLRGDSSFAKMSHEDLSFVDDLLFGNASYVDVHEKLLERGIKVSQTSIAEYYQIHLRPRIAARDARVAANVTAAGEGYDFEEATLQVAKQRVFEMLSMPQLDTLAIKRLLDFTVKSTVLEQNERKLALLEQRMAAADAAKEQLTRTALSESLSPEALAQIEEAIKLL